VIAQLGKSHGSRVVSERERRITGVDGEDVAGVLGIVLELLAQLRDVNVDGAMERDRQTAVGM
jgi:hypothetical protein